MDVFPEDSQLSLRGPQLIPSVLLKRQWKWCLEVREGEEGSGGLRPQLCRVSVCCLFHCVAVRPVEA